MTGELAGLAQGWAIDHRGHIFSSMPTEKSEFESSSLSQCRVLGNVMGEWNVLGWGGWGKRAVGNPLGGLAPRGWRFQDSALGQILTSVLEQLGLTEGCLHLFHQFVKDGIALRIMGLSSKLALPESVSWLLGLSRFHCGIFASTIIAKDCK